MRFEMQVFETKLGWMGAIGEASIGDEPLLTQLVIGAETAGDAHQAISRAVERNGDMAEFDTHGPSRGSSPWWARFRRRLREYADGGDASFDDVAVDLRFATPFQACVLNCCRRIGRGSTMSYAELATAAGRPGAARAVGNVMAKNRYPLVIPCHRVLHAGGGLGGFSAPQGVALKRRLLEMERSAALCGQRA